MAKLSKRKIHKRLRASKVKLIEETIVKDQVNRLHQKTLMGVKGFAYKEVKKPNAFLHPNDPEAEFPQRIPAKIIDFRSSHNPFAGFEQRGVCRKVLPGNLIECLNTEQLQEQEKEKKAEALKKKTNSLEDVNLINDMINMKFMKTDTHLSRKAKAKIGKTFNGKGLKRMLKF